jgi:hypothetical protein
LLRDAGLEHGIHVDRFADGERMDAVDRAFVKHGEHSVAIVAGIDELDGGGHKASGVTARSECLPPPTFRGPNEDRDGPQNEERKSY